MPELKRKARIRRVIELRVLGYTIPMIHDALKKEGFIMGISERQIFTDLRSTQALAVVDEIKRKQLSDIAIASSVSVRLKYRDKLLGKIIPKKIDVSSRQAGEVKHKHEFTGLLSDFAELFPTAGEDTLPDTKGDDTREQVAEKSKSDT